jgi:hypothetical protein
MVDYSEKARILEFNYSQAGLAYQEKAFEFGAIRWRILNYLSFSRSSIFFLLLKAAKRCKTAPRKCQAVASFGHLQASKLNKKYLAKKFSTSVNKPCLQLF